MSKGQPKIAIVGRPNVGKSTFFNRLVGKRKAIESDIPGTTRDRIYGHGEWNGKQFSLIDTAGLLDETSEKEIADLSRISIEIAIDESDIIVFLVDVNDIASKDREIGKILHKSKKKVLLVANKADNEKKEATTKDLLSLGFGEANFVSAISGRGTGDFLDLLVKDLPKTTKEKKDENTIDVAIIGRPNVGKSTLLNSILGKSKALVSEIPGTTRDSVDAEIIFEGQRLRFVDTAGIRRRGKIDQGIEKFSVLRTLLAIEDSKVVVILFDAKEGLTNQDAHIIGTAKDQGKSIVLVVNKFDLFEEEKRPEILAGTLAKMRKDLAFVPYAPVVFMSAKTGENQKILLKKVVETFEARFIEIPKDELSEIIHDALERNPQIRKVSDFYQERVNPPVFKLVTKNRKDIHFSHLRYLENVIRDQVEYIGVPIFIDIIEKSKN